MTTNLRLTKGQENVLRLRHFDDQALQALHSAMMPIVHGYDFLWKLPEAELRDTLQALHDSPAPEGSGFTNELERLLVRHYLAGTALNNLLDAGGYGGTRAQTTKPREWVVVDGNIVLTPLPVETPPDPVEPDLQPEAD